MFRIIQVPSFICKNLFNQSRVVIRAQRDGHDTTHRRILQLSVALMWNVRRHDVRRLQNKKRTISLLVLQKRLSVVVLTSVGSTSQTLRQALAQTCHGRYRSILMRTFTNNISDAMSNKPVMRGLNTKSHAACPLDPIELCMQPARNTSANLLWANAATEKSFRTQAHRGCSLSLALYHVITVASASVTSANSSSSPPSAGLPQQSVFPSTGFEWESDVECETHSRDSNRVPASLSVRLMCL